MKQYLIYIDEEDYARDIYGHILQSCIGDEVEVNAIPPDSNLDDMVNKIENCVGLVSMVIDQKLTAKGTADYVGTDLVSKLRLVEPLIPIYILTNYADDVNQYLPSIDYVLSKDDLSDQVKLTAIGARIQRHINIFNQIKNDREQRFEELLRKRFEEPLNEKENLEYITLKYQRERKVLSSTFIDSDDLTKKIKAAEKKLESIEQMLREKK